MEEGNWIDTVVYMTLLLSTLFGVWRGLFSSLFGIIALVGAIIVAWDFGILLRPSLRPLLGDSPLLPVVSFALTFLIAFMLLGIIARMLAVAMQKTDVGGLNLLGGAAFGFLRGGVLAALFVLALGLIGVQQTKTWRQADTVPMVGQALQTVMQTPLASDYRKWLRFDRQGRPLLRGSGIKTAQKKRARRLRDLAKEDEARAKGESVEEEGLVPEAELIQQLQGEREKEYLSVMDELGNQVNIRSEYTPPKESVYHGEDKGGGALVMHRLLCALGQQRSCDRGDAAEEDKE